MSRPRALLAKPIVQQCDGRGVSCRVAFLVPHRETSSAWCVNGVTTCRMRMRIRNPGPLATPRHNTAASFATMPT
jgi:hypothetical protein